MDSYDFSESHATSPHAFGSKYPGWSYYFLDAFWPCEGEQPIKVGDELAFENGTFAVTGVDLRTPDPDGGGLGDEVGVFLHLSPPREQAQE
jgi:hypothetical protein